MPNHCKCQGSEEHLTVSWNNLTTTFVSGRLSDLKVPSNRKFLEQEEQ